MDKNQEKLFEKYVKAAEDFYNGIPVKMNDEQYDKLEKEVLSFMPDFNVKTYITYHQQGVSLKHHAHFIPYTKSPDKSLTFEVLKAFGDFTPPKYDGCSVVAYYRNGDCYQIISRADDKVGKNQYDKLIKKFNDTFGKLHPSITEVFCEAVVNKKYGDRSKANGLINSKYMQKEVDEKLEIMPCECYSPDPVVRREFCEKFVHNVDKEEMDLILETGFTKDGIPADGIVAYNPEDYKMKMRKVYYNGSAITKITGHEMTFSDKTLTQAAVCNYTKVFVDGANCTNAKMGPVNTLKKLGLGLGAEVEVIRMKKITPYIKSVITKSDDFSDIKCKFCGKSMQSVGEDLMCVDLDCPGMNKHLFRRIASVSMKENPEVLIINQGFRGPKYIEGLKIYISENKMEKEISNKIKSLDAEGVFKLFRIPRFDFKKKFKDVKSLNEKVKSATSLNEKLTYFYPKCSPLQKTLVKLTLDRVLYILNKLGIES